MRRDGRRRRARRSRTRFDASAPTAPAQRQQQHERPDVERVEERIAAEVQRAHPRQIREERVVVVAEQIRRDRFPQRRPDAATRSPAWRDRRAVRAHRRPARSARAAPRPAARQRRGPRGVRLPPEGGSYELSVAALPATRCEADEIDPLGGSRAAINPVAAHVTGSPHSACSANATATR